MFLVSQYRSMNCVMGIRLLWYYYTSYYTSVLSFWSNSWLNLKVVCSEIPEPLHWRPTWGFLWKFDQDNLLPCLIFTNGYTSWKQKYVISDSVWISSEHTLLNTWKDRWNGSTLRKDLGSSPARTPLKMFLFISMAYLKYPNRYIGAQRGAPNYVAGT